MTDIGTGSDLTGSGEGFERFGQIVWSGGSKMEHDEAGSDGRGGFVYGNTLAIRTDAGASHTMDVSAADADRLRAYLRGS